MSIRILAPQGFMMAGKSRPITVFNILALAALVVGGGMTLVLSFAHIDLWIKSGENWEVGKTQKVTLQPGELVIFFQSPGPLPANHDGVSLHVRDEQGQRLVTEPMLIIPEETYAPRPFLAFTKYAGRPLWKVQIPAAGTYSIFVQNDLEDETRTTEEERVFVGKNPQSFAQVHETNNLIKIAGLSLTGALFVGFYFLHGIALARRNRAAQQESIPEAVAMDIDDF